MQSSNSEPVINSHGNPDTWQYYIASNKWWIMNWGRIERNWSGMTDIITRRLIFSLRESTKRFGQDSPVFQLRFERSSSQAQHQHAPFWFVVLKPAATLSNCVSSASKYSFIFRQLTRTLTRVVIEFCSGSSVFNLLPQFFIPSGDIIENRQLGRFSDCLWAASPRGSSFVSL
jgi:hypothetical protein